MKNYDDFFLFQNLAVFGGNSIFWRILDKATDGVKGGKQWIIFPILVTLCCFMTSLEKIFCEGKHEVCRDVNNNTLEAQLVESKSQKKEIHAIQKLMNLS